MPFILSPSFSCLDRTLLPKNTSKPLARHLFDENLQIVPAETRRSEFSQTFAYLSTTVNSGQTDAALLANLLKASSSQVDISAGEQLHAHSVISGLALDPGVQASLITFYSTVDLLDSAIKVFHEIPAAKETALSPWNAVISAYSFHGNYNQSLLLFSAMLSIASLAPIASTYAIIIKACTSKRNLEFGKALHAMIIKDKTDDKANLLNSITNLYCKCGDLIAAGKVFDAMDGSDVVSWNVIISGHVQNADCETALALFRRMVKLTTERVAVKLSRITLLCVLSAVSLVQALKLGKEIHAKIIREGLEEETTICNSLINMYGKCGEEDKARLVFSILPSPDLVSWNSILFVFAQSDKLDDYFELLKKMRVLRIGPDSHTFTTLLLALSTVPLSSNSYVLAREIHGYLLRTEMCETQKVSAYNAMIVMYAKNERIEDACRLFDWIKTQDSYSWNAIIDGYFLNGLHQKAVFFFVKMVEEGFWCDHVTFSILLSACGHLVCVGLGKQIHGFMVKYDLHCCKDEASMLSSSNALISMYSRFGSITDASMVFKMMPRRDSVSWTAMITAFSDHGMARDSIHFFEMMKKDGMEPNSITYLALLTACAHSGLINKAKFYFSLMLKESEIEVGILHYAAMVDLFGRAGQFREAEAMAKLGSTCLGSMNNGAGSCLWRNLLGACYAHNQLELGIWAGKKVLEIDPADETAYVLLSNLYASCGMWEDMIEVRKMMKERGLKKEAGCSWVEIGGKKHCFVAGDACHPNRKEIYVKLKKLNAKFRGEGYVPKTEFVLHDVENYQKTKIISFHSEKLAVTFALLQKNGGAIRVFKNLRVCGDCHEWMKIASLVEGKEIVLRDSKRFHAFKDGNCSCGDYW